MPRIHESLAQRSVTDFVAGSGELSLPINSRPPEIYAGARVDDAVEKPAAIDVKESVTAVQRPSREVGVTSSKSLSSPARPSASRRRPWNYRRCTKLRNVTVPIRRMTCKRDRPGAPCCPRTQSPCRRELQVSSPGQGFVRRTFLYCCAVWTVRDCLRHRGLRRTAEAHNSRIIIAFRKSTRRRVPSYMRRDITASSRSRGAPRPGSSPFSVRTITARLPPRTPPATASMIHSSTSCARGTGWMGVAA